MSAPVQVTDQFRSWLKTRNYSSSTIRNYLVDVNKYLSTVSADEMFSTTAISNYLASISDPAYLRRSLASLNKFSLFGLDQNYITQNPIKKIRRQQISFSPNQIDQLLTDYQQHLVRKKRTTTTIRNYLNDLRQYINWLTENSIQNPPPSLEKGGNDLNSSFTGSPSSKGDVPQLQDKGVSV